MIAIVVDTNVLVSALLRGGRAARSVIRACLTRQYVPFVGPALLAEYEDMLGRTDLFSTSTLTSERTEVPIVARAHARAMLGGVSVSTLTIRLPDDKHERLKATGARQLGQRQ